MNNLRINAIWYTIGLTLNSFNSLFFLIIINRVNGVDTAGIFSFAFSIACLLYIVGIYSGRVYQVSDLSGELNDYEYLIHKIMTCSIAFLIAIIFIIIKDYSVKKNIIIILLTIYKCFESFSDVFYGFLQKNEKLYIVGKSLSYKTICGVVIFLATDYITNNILLSCSLLVLNSLFWTVFYDIRKSMKLVSISSYDFIKIIKFFKVSFSVFAFMFLSVYIVNVPKYIMDILLSNSFQTIFGIIIMPATVVSLCGQYIVAPFVTQMTNYYNREEYNGFNKLVIKLLALLLAIGIVIEICSAFFGIPVLSILYAIDLRKYWIDLMIIMIGAICYALAGIISTAMITMRANNGQFLIYSIDALVGTIIGYFLISTFGIHGATYSYVITMIIHVLMYLVYYTYYIRKLLKKTNKVT